ncbi:hypothetical protein FO519_003137, partial [Halicephalobus sp. NKZ332]
DSGAIKIPSTLSSPSLPYRPKSVHIVLPSPSSSAVPLIQEDPNTNNSTFLRRNKIMPALGVCGLIMIVLVTVCLFQSVIAGHLGPSYGHQRRAIPDPDANENPLAGRRKTEEEITSAAQAAVAGLPFADRLPQSSKPPVNLFEEYMSRGLYTCTSSYLDALGKLHALIAEVYEDYQACQKMMKTTAKTFSRTDIDALDDLLDEWEREDSQQKNPNQIQNPNQKPSSTPEPRIENSQVSS